MNEVIKTYQILDISGLNETQLRMKWHEEYTSKQIYTHDGIKVCFYDNNFDHAFYESSGRNVGKKSPFHKDILSVPRLERMLWIKDVLTDPSALMVMGYDNKSKTYTKKKRVSIVKGNYVVVIQLYGDWTKAKFITAYIADSSIDKIIRSPQWDSVKNKKER